LQRLANALGCAAVELLDAPLRRVARLVVEVELGQHVGRDRAFYSHDGDVRPRCAGAAQQ
jgi:hypothetical protein